MSKLVNGLIPAHTECPFKSQCVFMTCEDTTARCKHKGLQHDCKFSCAAARLHDMLDKPKEDDKV